MTSDQLSLDQLSLDQLSLDQLSLGTSFSRSHPAVNGSMII